MLLKPDKKSKQFSRHLVPEVTARLKSVQTVQLAALRENVAELKKDFALNMKESRIMGPLLVNSAN